MQEQIEQTHIFVASPIKAETSSVPATLAGIFTIKTLPI
jgi:hypothetical protein